MRVWLCSPLTCGCGWAGLRLLGIKRLLDMLRPLWMPAICFRSSPQHWQRLQSRKRASTLSPK
jgi:hypothetical protein